MQTRTCFNGGELAPEMVARCDVDAYMRGLQLAENWTFGQMGGVTRRRGMRGVVQALGTGSRLVAYRYSSLAGNYIVEINNIIVRVFSSEGELQAFFISGEGGCPEFSFDEHVQVRQLNALLIITSRTSWPMELRLGDDGVTWTLERMALTQYPWRHHELRDEPITVKLASAAGATAVDVVFSASVPESEALLRVGDVLRATVQVPAGVAKASGSAMVAGITKVTAVKACSVGDKIGVAETVTEAWVCKQDFPQTAAVAGLDSPACYPDNFEKVEAVTRLTDANAKVVTSVSSLGSEVKADTVFWFRTGYWVYYTCIKKFTSADIVSGRDSYADYPEFFQPGIMVGNILPCRGKWKFLCSGLWYGEYEVQRSFARDALTALSAEWESAGRSVSYLDSPANTQLAGDEADEACWLRLLVLRTKWCGDSFIDGWAPDACGNMLLVEAYRHHYQLRCKDGGWEVLGAVQPAINCSVVTHDWSWAAWSERYGYPAACEVYSQRLVFASTLAQPQTLWMSRTDDIANFALGDSDDSAIDRTMYTTTQNPIGWMVESNGRLLLGTADAEWTISVPTGQAATPTNLWLTRHGRVGCTEGLCLAVDDKALFVQRGGGRLWAYGYSFEVDGCRSEDLTVFAPHVLQAHGGAVSATKLETPDTVAVFALADGQVALCTYNTLHNVHAWHRWTTDGRVLSVTALPDGNRADRLYLLVERADGVWIEVVDDDSPYVDRGGREYASTLVTTPLCNLLEQRVERLPKLPVKVLFGAECATRHLRVCSFGGVWKGEPMVLWKKAPTDCPVYDPGWHELLVVNSWNEAHAACIRYTGEGCNILALQA